MKMQRNFTFLFVHLVLTSVNCKLSVMTISAWNNYGVVEKFYKSVSQNVPSAEKHWFVADTPESTDSRIDTIRQKANAHHIQILTVEDVKKYMPYSPYELAIRYDMVCFNTAIKPHVFKYLFKEGYSKVIFFDPDCVIYNPLDDLIRNFISVYLCTEKKCDNNQNSSNDYEYINNSPPFPYGDVGHGRDKRIYASTAFRFVRFGG